MKASIQCSRHFRLSAALLRPPSPFVLWMDSSLFPFFQGDSTTAATYHAVINVWKLTLHLGQPTMCLGPVSKELLKLQDHHATFHGLSVTCLHPFCMWLQSTGPKARDFVLERTQPVLSQTPHRHLDSERWQSMESLLFPGGTLARP